MLISHEFKFIVGLPTKCGTNSMRNMALKHERHSKESWRQLHERPELRHRLDVPADCEDYNRAMIIRNPFSRIVSMYEYLRRHKWEWKYKDIMDAESRLGRRRAWTWFLNMLIDEQASAAEKPYQKRCDHGRRPFIWTDTLSQMCDFLGGSEPGQDFAWPQADVQLLRLESLGADWHAFLKGCGVGSELCDMWVPKKANATKGGQLFPGWRDYFQSSQNCHLGFMFVGEDLNLPYIPVDKPTSWVRG